MTRRRRVDEVVPIPRLIDIARTKVVVGRDMAALVPNDQLDGFERLWDLFKRDGQSEPPGDWTVWLMLAGRGFGKTRTGAEWLRHFATFGNEQTRLALVGATAHDARAVMVEGDSGLLATAPDVERPVWEPTLGRLVWKNGAQAYVYSAESPDRLRGPQFTAAWCDELAAWPDATAVATWINLRMGLRIGDRPRLVATTTPRPTKFVRDVIALRETVVTGGRTQANPMLAPSFISTMLATYGGTRLGRQELDGELIEDRRGALWTRATIEACRTPTAPVLRRVVVGVDPSGSADGDACGIVVAGVDDDGIGHVIADATIASVQPADWSREVARVAATYRATLVIAEANYGGNMVEQVLRAANGRMPVKLVHATGSKAARAEPVSLCYLEGRVRHVGTFPELEDELCGMVARGPYQGPGRSPDRADAAVWALSELLLGDPEPRPAIRQL